MNFFTGVVDNSLASSCVEKAQYEEEGDGDNKIAKTTSLVPINIDNANSQSAIESVGPKSLTFITRNFTREKVGGVIIWITGNTLVCN